MDLSPEEVRVLGCLVEKELATPQAYPLTLNSLRLACNQSTNRDPVVSYDDHLVESTLARLRERGLTRVVHNPSNRAPKHRHVIGEVWGLDRPQQAVLAVLALRGPQTLGELKARTERMSPFAGLGEVEETLAQLAAHEPEPLAMRLERRPGQKDARYVALLGAGSPEAAHSPDPSDGAPADRLAVDRPPPAPPPAAFPLSSSDDDLRTEVAAFRSELEELRAAFESFRSEFG